MEQSRQFGTAVVGALLIGTIGMVVVMGAVQASPVGPPHNGGDGSHSAKAWLKDDNGHGSCSNGYQPADVSDPESGIVDKNGNGIVCVRIV